MKITNKQISQFALLLTLATAFNIQGVENNKALQQTNFLDDFSTNNSLAFQNNEDSLSRHNSRPLGQRNQQVPKLFFSTPKSSDKNGSLQKLGGEVDVWMGKSSAATIVKDPKAGSAAVVLAYLGYGATQTLQAALPALVRSSSQGMVKGAIYTASNFIRENAAALGAGSFAAIAGAGYMYYLHQAAQEKQNVRLFYDSINEARESADELAANAFPTAQDIAQTAASIQRTVNFVPYISASDTAPFMTEHQTTINEAAETLLLIAEKSNDDTTIAAAILASEQIKPKKHNALHAAQKIIQGKKTVGSLLPRGYGFRTKNRTNIPSDETSSAV